MPTILLRILLLSVICLTGKAGLADWTRFRGPNGTGVSADSLTTPTEWSPDENVSWKVALPGPGSSCPIVVGDRVFVTCWSGYGVDRGSIGRQEELVRHLVCYHAKSGELLWDKTVPAVLPEDEYGGMFAQHGYASHTPVSDGERVYVYFGKTGALAFDLDGNQLWQRGVGTESDPRGWGSASSPILFEDLLIVTASAESEALVAINKESGEEVWRKEAAGLGSLWGTPILVDSAEGRTDLVLAVPGEIWGFSPSDGKFRWYCQAMNNDSFCSSAVSLEDTVFAIEGRGGGSIAVRVGGQGDVTETHTVWSGGDSNRIGTPIVYDGRIYFFTGGIANCIDAKTGDRVFRSRLRGAGADASSGDPEPAEGRGRRGGGGMGGDYASPVAADGKIYYTTRAGEMFVIKAGDKFEQLAVNRVTADREDFSATPAISDGRIFVRSDKHLYCVTE